MRGVEFSLLFFIVYDIVITWILFYLLWKMKSQNDEKDELIDDLYNELAKIQKK